MSLRKTVCVCLWVIESEKVYWEWVMGTGDTASVLKQWIWSKSLSDLPFDFDFLSNGNHVCWRNESLILLSFFEISFCTDFFFFFLPNFTSRNGSVSQFLIVCFHVLVSLVYVFGSHVDVNALDIFCILGITCKWSVCEFLLKTSHTFQIFLF